MGERDRAGPASARREPVTEGAEAPTRLPRRTAVGPGAPAAGGRATVDETAGHAAFAGAVSAGIHDDVVAAVRVTHRTEDFPLDQSLDETGIAARSPSHARFSWGLTEGRPTMHASSTVGAAPSGGFGVTQLAVELAFRDRRKFVTHNAPPGGQRFALIDAHEQRHVDDFQRRLGDEDTRFAERVAAHALPTLTSPVPAADQAAAEAAIGPRVSTALQAALAAFGDELDAAQDRIDGPDGETARALRDLVVLDPELAHGAFSDGHPTPSVSYEATPGELFVHGIRAQDVVQGQLADCYLAAALASLAGSQPDVIRSMIQPAGGHDYRVRLFQWDGDHRTERHITVDDYLPHTATGSLGYMRSSERTADGGRELWPMLVEKAYAQLHGGYDDMGDGGEASHALSVLTGSRPNDLAPGGSRDGTRMQLVAEAVGAHQPVVMTTRRDLSHDDEHRLGLYAWHSYPVIAIDPPGRTVRLRNVWGHRFTEADAPGAAERGMTDAAEFSIGYEDFERAASSISTT